MPPDPPVIAVTGADGFIGRNLVVRLGERGRAVRPITRETPAPQMQAAIGGSDVVIHLAGANRPADPADFLRTNRDHTADVARAIAAGGRRPLVVFASSVKAAEDTPYGHSKAAGEAVLRDLAGRGAARAAIWRLPNVFGKWARPHYNSAIATFCHDAARGLPLHVDDPDAPLALLHIDDLLDQWLALIDAPPAQDGIIAPRQVHHTTVGAAAALIRRFAEGRESGEAPPAGDGLARALYATFAAALPVEKFSYPLAAHVDPRGRFTEMLRLAGGGQISCLTANPGATRGGHYHHAKVEKFLVVHGRARFRFRHVVTGERHEIAAAADRPEVVEAVPGWSHDVTNIGDDLLVAMVWASEPFDPARPDTAAMPL